MAVQKASKNLQFAAVLVAAVALVGAGIYFLKAPGEAQRRLPAEQIITYTGLPADAKISGELSMGGKTTALKTTDKAFALSSEQRADFYVPYTIKAQLHSQKSGYRDLSWRIERNGAAYFILADGFRPSDKISLSINGQTVFTIPFDWSGRIELPIILRTGMDTTACITIEEEADTMGFCHYTTGGAA